MVEDYIKILQKDRIMKKIIQNVGPCTIRKIPNPFEALIDGIITQQISDSAGQAIALRFRQLFNGKFPTPQMILEYNEIELKSVGLSRMKSQYILDISQKVINGELNFKKFTKLEDEEIISELIKIRGIGRWTAEMYLIFGLGRKDIFPLGDLGLINGIKKIYSLNNPDISDIKNISNKWKPYRTFGTWYIWKGVKNFQYV
ncbi:MAG: DNA-3-methyladenine glycosylase family protein [Nitrosopumilus sp.]